MTIRTVVSHITQNHPTKIIKRWNKIKVDNWPAGWIPATIWIIMAFIVRSSSFKMLLLIKIWWFTKVINAQWHLILMGVSFWKSISLLIHLLLIFYPSLSLSIIITVCVWVHPTVSHVFFQWCNHSVASWTFPRCF